MLLSGCDIIIDMSTQQDPLYSIIGDTIRVKMLRIFTLNKDSLYVVKDFTKALRKREESVEESLKWLEQDTIIIKKKFSVSERKSRGIRELKGYGFNKRYAHREFLDMLIRKSLPTEKDILAKKIVRVPGVQCVVTTDVFVEKRDGCIDLMVASADNNESHLQKMVQLAERSIGRELRCVFLTVNDLLHRLHTNDRFIRSILEEEHTIHLDKIGLSQT